MQAVNYAEFISGDLMAAGDTKNEIRVRLLNRFGTYIDLTDATVTWSGIQDRRQVIADRTAQPYIQGQVGIRFRMDDNLKAGNLYLQFTVTKDGKDEVFPAFGNLFLKLT